MTTYRHRPVVAIGLIPPRSRHRSTEVLRQVGEVLATLSYTVPVHGLACTQYGYVDYITSVDSTSWINTTRRLVSPWSALGFGDQIDFFVKAVRAKWAHRQLELC